MSESFKSADIGALAAYLPSGDASCRVGQMSYPLEYTPRKFAVHQDSGHLIIIETDHNAYTEETKQARKLQMAEVRTAFFAVFEKLND